MAPISERRQRNSNNWNLKHRPGTSKSVAMRIAYDWFFDTRIDSSGPTISNSIGWSFLCGQCQATPYIPSMPASITYWHARLKLKLILIARLSSLKSCNLLPGQPKDMGMWAASDWKGATWIGTVLLDVCVSHAGTRTWTGLVMPGNVRGE